MTTGIKIETTKEVSGSGEIGYKITALTALTRSQLPSLYLYSQKKPVVLYASDGDLRLENCQSKALGGDDEQTYWVQLKSFHTVQSMDKINAHVKAAGQHLAEVNTRLRKKCERWNGKVVFVDGEQTESASGTNPSGVELAKKIAELQKKGKLLYCDEKGQIRSLR